MADARSDPAGRGTELAELFIRKGNARSATNGKCIDTKFLTNRLIMRWLTASPDSGRGPSSDGQKLPSRRRDHARFARRQRRRNDEQWWMENVQQHDVRYLSAEARERRAQAISRQFMTNNPDESRSVRRAYQESSESKQRAKPSRERTRGQAPISPLPRTINRVKRVD